MLSVLVGELTGTLIFQPETEVQVIGYSTPLIRMLFTPTGAVPLRVTRLLLVTMKLVPLRLKDELPPARLISLSAATVRCEIYAKASA